MSVADRYIVGNGDALIITDEKITTTVDDWRKQTYEDFKATVHYTDSQGNPLFSYDSQSIKNNLINALKDIGYTKGPYDPKYPERAETALRNETLMKKIFGESNPMYIPDWATAIKIVGASSYSLSGVLSPLETNIETSSTNLNITQLTQSNSLDEVIGGYQLRVAEGSKEKDKFVSVTIGNTNLTVGNVTVTKLIGGTKAIASGLSVITQNIHNQIQNRTKVADGEDNGRFVGGNYLEVNNNNFQTKQLKGETGTILNTFTGGDFAKTDFTAGTLVSTNVGGAELSNTDKSIVTNVSGGEFGTVFGGARAYSTTNSKATADVTAAELHILGGTIKENIYGGSYAKGEGASSTVDSALITVAGGSIEGNIVAGGLAENQASSTVKAATVKFLNPEFSLKGSVTGEGAEKAVLVFGDETQQFNGSFTNKFEKFDEIQTGAGSAVKLASIGADNFKNDALKFTGKGKVEADKLALEKETLQVLGGGFIAHGAVLNGGMLYLDPAWSEDPTLAAIENPGEINSKIVVGQNSALTLGSADTSLSLQALKEAGKSLSENDVKGVAYVAAPITLGDKGALVVDGSSEGKAPADAPDGTSVKADSALVVSGDIVGAAIKGTGDQSFTTEDGAIIMIHGAKAGQNTTVADGFKMSLAKGTQYLTTNRVLGAEKISVDEDGNLIVGVKGDTSALSNALIPNTLLAAADGAEGQGATRLNNLLDRLNGLTDAQAEQAINSIALMGAASGAQTIAVNTSSLIQDTLNYHGSTLAAYAHEKVGMDLWIDVNGAFSKTNDYKAGNEKFGYKSDLTGFTVGGDYAFGNGAALGLAASFGKGSVRGQGAGAGIKNKIDYYGVNLYGIWNTPYANLIGTVGYLQSKNEIKHLGYKGKPDAKTFSVGLRAEKPLELNQFITVTPHIGVEYMHVKLDSFNAGGISYKADKANLVQVPFGVAFNGNVQASCGAKIKPFVDFTIAPNFGDRKVSNKVGLVGTGTLDSFDARIANNAMYKGKVGVETSRGNHSFGLNYGIGGGDRGRVDQAIQAKYRYQF